MFTTRRTIVTATAALALAGAAVLGTAAPASASTVNGTTKIGICMATGSATNPYVFQHKTVDALVAGKYSTNDIVPVFTYTSANGEAITTTGQNTSSTVVTADCVPVAAEALWL